MAQPTPTTNSSTSTWATIKVYHLTPPSFILLKALKSEGEHSTITQACAKRLGHGQTSAVEFEWRTENFGTLWSDSFEIVSSPTAAVGVKYDIVLSSQASENLLRAGSGAFVALPKSKSKEEKKKQEPGKEADRRRVDKEADEERRKRKEKYEKEVARRQPPVAAAS